MTCVISSTPWHHFNDHLPWAPTNSDTASSLPGLEKSLSSGYVSPGSDTRKSSTSSGKKRASRAGTRSVSTLSAAQLERKRANDREAQRAIRQRTKDHIDHLERSIHELRGSQEASEKLVHVTQQRNRELEDEVAYLRGKLSQAGFDMNVLPTERTASGSSIQRPGSTSTPGNQSMTTQSTGSRHGSWQHQAAGFVGTAATAIGLPSAAAVAGAPSLTTWRSHDNPQTMQDPLSAGSSGPYHQDQRVDWPASAGPYQQYVTQEQQRQPQYETAPAQPQQGYQQPFGAAAPQSEFPSISVSSSPSSYQVQNQPTFQQPGSFQVAPMQVPTSGTEYTTSPHGQMQPPPLPNGPFHGTHGEQPYGTQPGNHALQYRDESANRSYSLAHYPTA
ncbi:hypothetical protein M409DRAFT_57251 [Zasmidium cellare ATCC 36951]|uniref:BZIP domain-containing protein n=1 Tax=Zasmidium cellare ATCC 36951 TaxID=1080233 RepID=A0A6A6CC29_ZASCE|nr:uncharacterized protein M409DRAFT_57251 [Zasmidium cellare ATCC 36951]KAF2163768.1 hypothetical protein M409DRAFT_57251 [Zasmidium cellare ATCC 36951]